MEHTSERRRERRLRYHWPVWFAEDFNEILSQGQMVDVSSGGAAFTCQGDRSCPYPGQEITARFSVPHFGSDNSFNLTNFIRSSRVCRVDYLSNNLHRIAVQFHQALPFKPGEQADNQDELEQELETASTV